MGRLSDRDGALLAGSFVVLSVMAAFRGGNEMSRYGAALFLDKAVMAHPASPAPPRAWTGDPVSVARVVRREFSRVCRYSGDVFFGRSLLAVPVVFRRAAYRECLVLAAAAFCRAGSGSWARTGRPHDRRSGLRPCLRGRASPRSAPCSRASCSRLQSFFRRWLLPTFVGDGREKGNARRSGRWSRRVCFRYGFSGPPSCLQPRRPRRAADRAARFWRAFAPSRIGAGASDARGVRARALGVLAAGQRLGSTWVLTGICLASARSTS